jgi:hypothetical protein
LIVRRIATRRLLLVLLCIACNAVLFRGLLLRKSIAPGQVMRGSFEIADDHVSVGLVPWSSPHMWPDDFLGKDGQIIVMPGRSIGLPLVQGVSYTIADAGKKLPPYVILGLLPEEGRWSRLRHVAQPLTPSADAPSGTRLTPWQQDRPWREDELRLANLARACGEGRGGPPKAVVRGGAGGWSLTIGGCETTFEPEERPGTIPVLVALGATDGVTVDKSGVPLQVNVTLAGSLVVFVLLAALLANAGLGGTGALTTSAGAAALGMASPTFGVILFFSGHLVSAVALLVRAARLLRARKRRALTVAALLVCVGGVGLLYLRERPSATEPGGHAGCVVTGYSTAEGETLSKELHSAGNLLRSECTACDGSVQIRPRNGGRFSWVADTFCAPESLAASARALLFLGGGNDDFSWGQTRLELISRLGRLILFTLDPPTFQQWTAMRADAEAASLAAIDQQSSAIRRTTECMHGRLFLFHDFLVWDLPAGRSVARQTMLERRRIEVERAGGRFVDLLEATRAHASVTWFNDYIHLSQVGHRVAANLMCAELSRP